MKRILSGRAAETREHDGNAPGAAPLAPDERQEARKALVGALADHGLPSAAPAELLVDHLALLIRWRRRRRIAGPAEPHELAVEAIVDTACYDHLVPRCGTLFDVGSGAGLPGIPLAVLGPDRRVTLVEPATARAALLRVAVATLGLPLRVLACRGEELAADVEAGREPAADTAIARAFLPPDEWLALARRLVRPGGSVLVLAGRTWGGPASGRGVQVAERRDYELHGRGPRTAWRILVGAGDEGSGLSGS
jgi:16S rRNA (guanine527-N7)-methyltransferase